MEIQIFDDRRRRSSVQDPDDSGHGAPGPGPGGILPEAFLPDATIRELGLVETEDDGPYGTYPYVVRYDHPVSGADLAHAQDVASRFPDTFADTLNAPERPGVEFRIVIIALVLLFAVSVTGIAIALGEAESRPEQRSLLAIGADPRLRRRIAASRAAVLALLAGVLAVPAGLLPIWGIFASRGSPLAVPMLEIAGAVLVLHCSRSPARGSSAARSRTGTPSERQAGE